MKKILAPYIYIFLLTLFSFVLVSCGGSSGGAPTPVGSDASVPWSKMSNASTVTHGSSIRAVAFNHDSTKLASGSVNNDIKIWDAAAGTIIRTLSGHSGDVSSVAFNHDSTKLASGSYDNTVKIWDTGTGAVLATLAPGHSTRVHSVAFSPDGSKLASASGDKTIKIWDIGTSALLETFTGHANGLLSVAFSPDGTKLATGGWTAIKIWDVVSLSTTPISTIATTTGHIGISSISFSPDGTKLVSGTQGFTSNVTDSSIKVWDVSNASAPSLIKTLDASSNGHIKSVLAVAFSKDGVVIVTGSSDNYIKMWDVENGYALIANINARNGNGHTYSVTSLDFSPDGTKLASGSWDKTIKIWQKQ